MILCVCVTLKFKVLTKVAWIGSGLSVVGLHKYLGSFCFFKEANIFSQGAKNIYAREKKINERSE